jgi:hypothetical protein
MKNVVFWDIRPAAIVRTEVSEELSTCIFRVTKIVKLGTTLAVTINQRALRNIPDHGILHSHRRENLKSYKTLTG